MDEPTFKDVIERFAKARALDTWIELLREDPEDESAIRLADAMDQCAASYSQAYFTELKNAQKAALDALRR